MRLGPEDASLRNLATQSTEARDVALAASGDHHAFERLYRSSAPRIYSLARRMAGEESAEDLTQEIFLRAWQKLGTFRGDAGFGTWLHRLAINWILTQRASMAKRRERQAGADGFLETVAARPDRPGLRMDFEEAIERLPEGARHVFVLYDVEGFSHDEIAKQLAISVGTSKSQLHRARMILRKHLGPTN